MFFKNIPLFINMSEKAQKDLQETTITYNNSQYYYEQNVGVFVINCVWSTYIYLEIVCKKI